MFNLDFFEWNFSKMKTNKKRIENKIIESKILSYTLLINWHRVITQRSYYKFFMLFSFFILSYFRQKKPASQIIINILLNNSSKFSFAFLLTFQLIVIEHLVRIQINSMETNMIIMHTWMRFALLFCLLLLSSNR